VFTFVVENLDRPLNVSFQLKNTDILQRMQWLKIWVEAPDGTRVGQISYTATTQKYDTSFIIDEGPRRLYKVRIGFQTIYDPVENQNPIIIQLSERVTAVTPLITSYTSTLNCGNDITGLKIFEGRARTPLIDSNDSCQYSIGIISSDHSDETTQSGADVTLKTLDGSCISNTVPFFTLPGSMAPPLPIMVYFHLAVIEILEGSIGVLDYAWQITSASGQNWDWQIIHDGEIKSTDRSITYIGDIQVSVTYSLFAGTYNPSLNDFAGKIKIVIEETVLGTGYVELAFGEGGASGLYSFVFDAMNTFCQDTPITREAIEVLRWE
jgi:hypothetical protein